MGTRYPGVFFSRNNVAVVEPVARCGETAPFIPFQYLKTHVCGWSGSWSGLRGLHKNTGRLEISADGNAAEWKLGVTNINNRIPFFRETIVRKSPRTKLGTYRIRC